MSVVYQALCDLATAWDARQEAIKHWSQEMKVRNGPHRVSVTFGGVLLQCEGTYYAGFPGDHTDPPEAEMFEFDSVKHRDEDVLGLLGDGNVEALERACISELKA